MTIKNYFKREMNFDFWSMESLTLIYIVFTSLLIAFYWKDLDAPLDMVLTRCIMLLVMVI